MSFTSKQEWVNNLCLENEVINTRNLSKQKITDWMITFNKEFGTAIETETFKRYLREGKEYTRECMGLDKKEPTPIQIVLPTKDVGNILVIGDLHEPFSKEGYLEFCLEMKKKHNCKTVVFIGDIIDMHMSSYHESCSDGDYSAGGELNAARQAIGKWHEAFPGAFVCMGNHDHISNRKAFSAGLSNQWIRPVSEVLQTPSWTYSDEFVFDDIKYTHGTGMKARQRAKSSLMSVVQGHYHSESYIEHYVGNTTKIFAMQIGTGINHKSYAFAYAKHFPKPHINVGVIKDKGALPIIEYMPLKS